MEFRSLSNLTLEQKHAFLRKAKEKAFSWWVDILDCSQSFARQQVEMPFEEALQKINGTTHMHVTHRKINPENHIEIGFRTSAGAVDYFLWILLDSIYLQEVEAWTHS